MWYLWIFSTWNSQSYTRYFFPPFKTLSEDIKQQESFASRYLTTSRSSETVTPSMRRILYKYTYTQRTKWDQSKSKHINAEFAAYILYNILKCVCTQSLSAELPLLEYYFRSYYSLNTRVRKWNKFQRFYSTPLGPWPIKSGKAVHVNGFLISLGCTKEI